jgi:hypothetical protein
MAMSQGQPHPGASAAPLAATARWIAAARAGETRRPDRLLEDPWAAALAGPEGEDWLGARAGSPALAVMIIRARFCAPALVRDRPQTLTGPRANTGGPSRSLAQVILAGTAGFPAANCLHCLPSRAHHRHPPKEAILQHARAAQRDLPRQQRYRAGRPTVWRKISHFTRRACWPRWQGPLRAGAGADLGYRKVGGE